MRDAGHRPRKRSAAVHSHPARTRGRSTRAAAASCLAIPPSSDVDALRRRCAEGGAGPDNPPERRGECSGDHGLPDACPGKTIRHTIEQTILDAAAKAHGNRTQVQAEHRDAAERCATVCSKRPAGVSLQEAWDKLPEGIRDGALYRTQLARAIRHALQGEAVIDDALQHRWNEHPVVVDTDRSALAVQDVCAEQALKSLEPWLCEERFRERLASPAAALLMVHERLPYLSLESPTKEARQIIIDPVLLRTASLLHSRLNDTSAALASGAGAGQATALFYESVLAEIELQNLNRRLLPDHRPPPGKGDIWFDGVAIRGAAGATLASLTEKLVAQHPEEANAAERIASRLRWLGENTDYAIGTPHQSLATILHRYGPRVDVPDGGISHPGCLIDRFEELIDAHARGVAETLNVSPRLAAALHLAKASGALISSTQSADALITQEVRAIMLRERTAQAGANVTASALTLSFPWHELAFYARGQYTGATHQHDLEAMALFSTLALTRDVIAAPDGRGLRDALLEYLDQRLLAYQSIPAFDRSMAAVKQLSTALSATPCDVVANRQLMYRRPAPIGPMARGGDRIVSQQSSLHEAFFAKHNCDSPGPTLLDLQAQVDPRALMQDAQAKYRARYQDSALLGAKASEMRRLARLPMSKQRVAGLEREILQQRMTHPSVQSSAAESLVQALNPLGTIDQAARQIIGVLLHGDTKERLRLVPFVGSSYELVQGLRHRKAEEVRQGAGDLLIDGFFLWASVRGPALADEMQRAAGAAYTGLRGYVAALRRPKFAWVNRTPLEVDEAGASGAEAGIAQAVSGEQLERPSEGEGVILEEEPRSAGGVAAPDPEGVDGVETPGEEPGEARSFDINYSEPGSGNPLESGSFLLEQQRRWSASEIESLAITVWDVELIMRNAHKLLALPKVAELGGKHAASLFEAAENDAAAQRAIGVFNTIKNQSPTLRNLFATALYLADDDDDKWLVSTAASPASTSFIERKITLPTDEILSQMRYVGPEGAVRSNPEEVMVHEFIHACTEATDNVGSQAARHRGAVVALTDQCLFEAGHRFAPRLAYESYTTMFGRYDVPFIDRLLGAFGRTQHENLRLDPLFVSHEAVGRDGIRVLGVKASERMTVVQARSMMSDVSILSDEFFASTRIPRHEYGARVERAVVCADYHRPAVAGAYKAFMHALNDLCQTSTVFEVLVDRVFPKRPGSIGSRWTLRFEVTPGPGSPPWSVNRARREVNFHAGHWYYMSRDGAAPVGWHRQAAGVLIDLALGNKHAVAAGEHTLNRGGAVYLETVILRELSTPQQRVSAALNVDPALLRRDAITAAKATVAEDRYLKKYFLDLVA